MGKEIKIFKLKLIFVIKVNMNVFKVLYIIQVVGN